MKALSQNDIQTAQSFLTQLVDVIQEDISGSTTRRKYQVFVTGGIGPGVTSSLFQTVYDQDFTLQTANPVLDLTVGLFYSGSTVTRVQTGEESTGRLLFPSRSLMMREKIDIYKQFAKLLLGDKDKAFYAPFADRTAAQSKDDTQTFNLTGKSYPDTIMAAGSKARIDEAIFFTFKRLFTRDGIKKETFAFKMFTTGFNAEYIAGLGPNVGITAESGSIIFTDANSSNTDLSTNMGGRIGEIVNSSNTDSKVGLIFYDKGVGIIDARKVMSGGQRVSGTISAMSPAAWRGAAAGQTIIGQDVGGTGNPNARFIPDFFVSGSVDNIIDHLAACRFSSGSLTAMTFQNKTNINSTLYFCRANADEFNYSSNPTFLDNDGNISVIDAAARQDGSQKAFTFVTKVGLHDAEGNLLAVAKLSRPVEKNSEKDITFRIRLDF
jgi:hypothetical protein